MQIDKRLWVVPVVACLALGIVGCGKGDPAGRNGDTAGGGADPGQTTDGSGNPTPREVEPPPPETIPAVGRTDEESKTHILDIGHTMPDAQLPGLDGEDHSLRPLYGEKLTVVCFWTLGSTTISQVFAGGILEDLAEDVAKPYAEKGVRVIAVNEGDSAQNVAALAGEVGVDQTLSIFLDPDGALFAKVATETLPRIYVLDAEGTVLWFDWEYSEITRDKLFQTIRVALRGI